MNGDFEVNFSSIYAGKFQHKLYAEALAGIAMQVQTISVTLRAKKA